MWCCSGRMIAVVKADRAARDRAVAKMAAAELRDPVPSGSIQGTRPSGHDRAQPWHGLDVAERRTAGLDFRRERLVRGGTQRTALLIRQPTSVARRQPADRRLWRSHIRSGWHRAGRRRNRRVKVARAIGPCRPGARPDINNCPAGSPNEDGELNHLAHGRVPLGKAVSLGQSGQFDRARCGRGRRRRLGQAGPKMFSIVEIVVSTPRRHGCPPRCRNSGRVDAALAGSPDGSDGSRPELD